MINKEKYFYNASNEELANILAELFSSIVSEDLNRMIENIKNPRIVKMPNGTGVSCKHISTYNKYHLNKEYVSNKILEWLSQEIEDKDEIKDLSSPSKTNHNATFRIYNNEITIKDWNDVIDKIKELDTRIDKLEEFTKIQIDDFWKKHHEATHNYDIKSSGYSYGTVETNKTADEMFEELGYKKDNDYKNTKCQIGVRYILKYANQETKKIIIEKYFDGFIYKTDEDITEAEDRAIHKKIEELKNGML